MPLWLSLYLVKRPLQISLSTLLQTGCFPKPVEPIIKGLVFQKGTCNSQSKKIPAIFAKAGDVIRQLYNAQNSNISLHAPHRLGGGDVHTPSSLNYLTDSPAISKQSVTNFNPVAFILKSYEFPYATYIPSVALCSLQRYNFHF